jgi:hypothetical protein
MEGGEVTWSLSPWEMAFSLEGMDLGDRGMASAGEGMRFAERFLSLRRAL